MMIITIIVDGLRFREMIRYWSNWALSVRIA
jgi:hypothetical protein